MNRADDGQLCWLLAHGLMIGASWLNESWRLVTKKPETETGGRSTWASIWFSIGSKRWCNGVVDVWWHHQQLQRRLKFSGGVGGVGPGDAVTLLRSGDVTARNILRRLSNISVGPVRKTLLLDASLVWVRFELTVNTFISHVDHVYQTIYSCWKRWLWLKKLSEISIHFVHGYSNVI